MGSQSHSHLRGTAGRVPRGGGEGFRLHAGQRGELGGGTRGPTPSPRPGCAPRHPDPGAGPGSSLLSKQQVGSPERRSWDQPPPGDRHLGPPSTCSCPGGLGPAVAQASPPCLPGMASSLHWGPGAGVTLSDLAVGPLLGNNMFFQPGT